MKNPPSPTCDQNPGVQVFTCHGLVPPEVGTKQPICGQDPDIFPFKILTHRYLFPKNRQISFYHNMYCNLKKTGLMVQWSKNNEKTSIQLRRSGAPLPQICPESAPCCPGAMYCLGVAVGGWLKFFRNAFLAVLRNSCCMDRC